MGRLSRRRRNTKKYKKSYKKQRGGKFNEEETERLKDKLSSLRIQDGSELTEEEINETIDELGMISQYFSGDKLNSLLNQIHDDELPEIMFANKDAFKDWVERTVYDFEIDVETDVDTVTPDDNDEIVLEDVNPEDVNLVHGNLEGGKKKKTKTRRRNRKSKRKHTRRKR